jgi:trk system potassium uptake protein TrkH
MRAEMPGPIIGNLVPRIKTNARVLYLIYIALTATEILLLLLDGMPLFESLVYSLGTAGTGGFGVDGDSLSSYSPYLQWVITVFMVIFGINFNLYYLILIGKFKNAIKSGELWAYAGIAFTSVAVISINIAHLFDNFGDAFRTSAFQVSSLITSTGFATADFNSWPVLSKTVLIVLMFIGACAGSTGGGFKVARVVMLVKMIKQELRRVIHPRSVTAVRFEGKALDSATLSSVSSYLAIYLVFFIGTLLLISFDSLSFESNFTATLSCINNIGPIFSQTNPLISFDDYGLFSKIVLSLAMLLGRLEIYPLLIALIPSTWTKK